ncbi:MAG: hypothetical protein HYY60_03240, partial [Parcubacteria group bacterium]|nr:hypothetical protein [Parcubacteria group bacterium]
MFRRMFLVLFSAAIFAGGVVPFNAYAARALGVRLSAGSYAPYEFKADGEKYSAPGTNIFVGISLLPPLVVIPGLDLGIEVDQFTAGSSYTANGT